MSSKSALLWIFRGVFFTLGSMFTLFVLRNIPDIAAAVFRKMSL